MGPTIYSSSLESLYPASSMIFQHHYWPWKFLFLSISSCLQLLVQIRYLSSILWILKTALCLVSFLSTGTSTVSLVLLPLAFTLGAFTPIGPALKCLVSFFTTLIACHIPC